MATQVLGFNEVLDAIEALSSQDQAVLLQILSNRLIDQRRAEIAQNITQAKADYQAGNVFRGSVADAIAALND
jgi:cytoplasmic iron level regulating protein YaaA (DUF328/UPF0246 family)